MTIYYEDATFFEMLIKYQNNNKDSSDVLKPCLNQLKSLKELNYEHMQLAYNQFDKYE